VYSCIGTQRQSCYTTDEETKCSSSIGFSTSNGRVRGETHGYRAVVAVALEEIGAGFVTPILARTVQSMIVAIIFQRIC